MPIARRVATQIQALSVEGSVSAVETMFRDVPFCQLNKLEVSVSELSADALLAFSHCSSLRTLLLYSGNIKMAALALLVDTSTHLRTLALSFDPSAESGAVHLASLDNAPHFPAFDATLLRAERNGLERMYIAYRGSPAVAAPYLVALRRTQRKLRWLALEIEIM